MTDISALGEYLSPDQAEAVLNFQWYDIRAGQRFDFQRFGLYGGAETSVGATVAGIGSSLGLVHDFDSEAIGITLSSSIPFKVEGYSGTLEATQNTGLKLFIGKYPPQSAYSVPLSDGLYMWLDPSFSIEAGGYAEITGALDTFKDRVGFEQVRIGNGIVFDLETRERIGTFAKTSYTDDRNSNYSLNFKTKFLEADFNAAEYRRSRVSGPESIDQRIYYIAPMEAPPTRSGSGAFRLKTNRGVTRRHRSGMANGVSSTKRRRTFSLIRDTLFS